MCYSCQVMHIYIYIPYFFRPLLLHTVSLLKFKGMDNESKFWEETEISLYKTNSNNVRFRELAAFCFCKCLIISVASLMMR
jgi:hypothetical protein